MIRALKVKKAIVIVSLLAIFLATAVVEVQGTPLVEAASFRIQGDYVTTGVGLRNRGYGDINIAGVPGGSTIQKAFLYWTILAPTEGASFKQGEFNGHLVEGTFIGSDIDPCWEDANSSDLENSWSYRADVTQYVSGNGTYHLSNFASYLTTGEDPWTENRGLPPMIEGASLVVIYSNSNLSLKDILVYEGNDEFTTLDTIEVTISGFEANGQGAKLAIICADGQDFPDNNIFFNDHFISVDTLDGGDAQAGPAFSSGNLWDTDIYDVKDYVASGDLSSKVAFLERTDTGGVYDCLVLVALVLSVEREAANQPPNTKIESAVIDESKGTATFTWSGSDDSTPAKDLLYCYRLRKDSSYSSWSSWSPGTTKTYTGLSAGSYRFQVRAKDGEGAIDPSPASREFPIGAMENKAPIARASDISGQQQIMYPDTSYSITTKYYDPNGRNDLKYCYLQLRHPEKPLTMMWYQADGHAAPWAGEEGENYLTQLEATATEIADADGTEGYELTWNLQINDQWPEVENALDFGVFSSDDGGLESGWDYDDTNASFITDTAPPTPIQNFVASDGENGQSTLTWTNPSDSDLDQVVVQRKTTGYPTSHTDGDTRITIDAATPGRKETFVDEGLTNGQTYYYAVLSKDSAGNWNDTWQEGKNADTGTPGLLLPAEFELPDRIHLDEARLSAIIKFITENMGTDERWPLFLKTQLPDYNLKANIVLIVSQTPIMDYKLVHISTSDVADLRDLILSAVLPSSPSGCIKNYIQQTLAKFTTDLKRQLAEEILTEIIVQITGTALGITIPSIAVSFIYSTIECIKEGYSTALDGWEPGKDYFVYLPLGLNMELNARRGICDCVWMTSPWIFCQDCPPNAWGTWEGNISDELDRIHVDIHESSNWWAEIFKIESPAELIIYDSQGHRTGVVNGEVLENIPNSIYDEEHKAVGIFFPTDSYPCKVVGTGKGTYGLTATFVTQAEATTFTATDIPITSGAVHQYALDWDALAQGEEGVILQIDDDGDGIFERTITANDELTGEEFSGVPTGQVVNNGPNPVNNAGTAFFYTLPEGTLTAKLMILNVRGRLLFETPLDVDATRFPSAGTWNPVDRDGVPLANGPYVYVLIADGKVIGQGKMVIQR